MPVVQISKLPIISLVILSVFVSSAIAGGNITIHVKAVGEDQSVSMVDEISNQEIFKGEQFTKDETKFPSVETDASGKAHVSWTSVSKPDAKGLCRFGHGDKSNVDDSTLVEIAVTSGPDNCPK
ncbi:hypothetical protein [Mesorhizobium sp. M6A.T.Cr.TU.016.01.1.1]|uniref:hypothetical protein n=1 Tax=Mesorhizobium sp. M6A.T.Cr.TU.016.01.1.1 TaxID=2493677 RepID=UPI000F75032F|nr:hypothetical protein [Mesorhizobium sp. M6A.T.Cr.TU.016.01.1.1]AZO68005.1 hypothetical protein EJ075_25860 [Mesorhizobium sp. M6A.T.Cr.TU.016.01.1.1]